MQHQIIVSYLFECIIKLVSPTQWSIMLMLNAHSHYVHAYAHAHAHAQLMLMLSSL